MVFLNQKVDRNMIFTDHWKVLILTISAMRNTDFFEPKSRWKDDIYWLLKSSCIELFNDGKSVFFELIERWCLMVTKKFLFWTFQWWEIRSLFQQKSWWKDDISLVFSSFPWYSRTWEIWFFAQCRFTKRPTFFMLLLKEELFIISITSGPFNINWLANFWRWATLIGSFEININIT